MYRRGGLQLRRPDPHQQVQGVPGPAPPAPARGPGRALLQCTPTAGVCRARPITAERGGGLEAMEVAAGPGVLPWLGGAWPGALGVGREGHFGHGNTQRRNLITPIYKSEPKRAPSHRGQWVARGQAQHYQQWHRFTSRALTPRSVPAKRIFKGHLREMCQGGLGSPYLPR